MLDEYSGTWQRACVWGRGLVTGRLESGLRNRKLVFIIYVLYLNFTKLCAYSTFSTFTHAVRIKISLKTCTELNNKT